MPNEPDKIPELNDLYKIPAALAGLGLGLCGLGCGIFVLLFLLLFVYAFISSM